METNAPSALRPGHCRLHGEGNICEIRVGIFRAATTQIGRPDNLQEYSRTQQVIFHGLEPRASASSESVRM